MSATRSGGADVVAMRAACAAAGLALLVGLTSARANDRSSPASPAPAAQATPPVAARHIGLRIAPGSSLAKLFTVEHKLVLKKMSLERNGVEQVSQQQMDLDSKQTLRVKDEYRVLDEGRPSILRRSFEEIGYRARLDLSPGDDREAPLVLEATSPLARSARNAPASVVFTWVPSEKAYGKHYDARECVEEWLSALSADLDLLALLPSGEVKVGDAWEIDPARLADAVACGGKLPFVFPKDADKVMVRTLSSGVGGGLYEVFGGEIKGRLSARLASLRTEGRTEGRNEGSAELAVIAIEADVETSRDQTGLARQTQLRDEFLEGSTVEELMVQWKLKGSGELVWNLTAGRFESFKLAGSEDVAMQLKMGLRGSEGVRQRLEMSGGLVVSAKIP